MSARAESAIFCSADEKHKMIINLATNSTKSLAISMTARAERARFCAADEKTLDNCLAPYWLTQNCLLMLIGVQRLVHRVTSSALHRQHHFNKTTTRYTINASLRKSYITLVCFRREITLFHISSRIYNGQVCEKPSLLPPCKDSF